MLKALFVIELAALLYSLSLVFGCNAAKGEAMDDLVLGALGMKDQIAVIKYDHLEPKKNECGVDGEVNPICPDSDLGGIRRDEDSDRERERYLR